MSTATLTFVESEDRYSTYRTAGGSYIYLEHGTSKRLVEFDALDLDALWREFMATSGRYVTLVTRMDKFRAFVQTLTIEPEVAEDIQACEDCTIPRHEDDLNSTGYESSVCETCYENYYWCESCEERFRETTTTLGDQEVCSYCRDNSYSFCDDCDGYYFAENGCGSEHEDEDEGHDDGCCESPARMFLVRNDGEEPLANDTRVTVSLPAGVISSEGLNEVTNYLRAYAYDLDYDSAERTKFVQLSWDLIDKLGEHWQTRDGNYTKRLSRLAHKEYGLKVPPEVISKVGCIARDHSLAVDHQIETTRNLNLPRSEFAHDGSCWWTEYSESRCALKTNGGFGLRTFTAAGYVEGRAWVMPLHQLEDGPLAPTFETLEPDAFVVFNGYGNLSGYVAARIVSHMAGMTYRKIEFTCGPMYINNESGYLVAPEAIAMKYTDGSLHLSVPQHSSLFNDEKMVVRNAA